MAQRGTLNGENRKRQGTAPAALSSRKPSSGVAQCPQVKLASDKPTGGAPKTSREVLCDLPGYLIVLENEADLVLLHLQDDLATLLAECESRIMKQETEQ